uniref:Uncharacterized protein n=1 Tax=Hyaloperonospora arabidopsidis (strain Emoy2) TaxID=559515 RepID=M4BYR0_HYAAE
MPVWTPSGQHCDDGFLPYHRTQSFDGMPFHLTQMGVSLIRWMEVFRFIIQHIHGR